MTIHIEYDREENKIELILDSQSNVIRTLGNIYVSGGFGFRSFTEDSDAISDFSS